MDKDFIPLEKSRIKSFTLIELIVVIIIVGILAAMGISQYSLMVEKARTAEAKVRLGVMRQLAYEYYLNNGSVTGMGSDDLGVDNTCHSTDFYRYRVNAYSATNVNLYADRCTGGGKTPNATREYLLWMTFVPSTGASPLCCWWSDNYGHCFGLPDSGESGCGPP